MNKMQVATIFSGGFAGAEWALKYANIPHKIIFACECDKFARVLYQANHTCEKFYQDITTLDANRYKNKIDLLIGGFPCQAFSTAGKRRGFKDIRGALFFVGFRSVEEYHAFEFPRPIKLTKCLADVLESEVDEKYFLSDKIIEVFKKHRQRHEKRGNGFKFEPKSKDDIATTISCKYGTRATDTYLKQIGNIDSKGHNSLWGRVYDTSGVSATLNAGGGGMGAKTGLYVVPRGNNKGGFRKILIAPTISTSSFEQNNFIEDKQFHIRRLTPRECFRLMGDEQDRVKFASLSDTQLYKNAGNGMEINVMRAIIEWIYGLPIKIRGVKQRYRMQNETGNYYIESKTLSQYTGLEDKNGKEIYEGDIIKISYPISQNIPSYVLETFYHEDLAQFGTRNKSNTHYASLSTYKHHYNSIEVIGNIYESPELLEQS